MKLRERKIAVIFDMDGVMVDNIPYHIEAWKRFAESKNCSFTDEEFNKYISGRTQVEGIKFVLKRNIDQGEVEKFSNERNSIYMDLYRPHITPQKGLMRFLRMLKDNEVKIGVATSGSKVTLDFVLKGINAENYFDTLVYEDIVKKGKPDPEIYLKTANLLYVSPENCIVIEDSLSGIQAGLSAGMKVIGITTVHKKDELSHTNMVIDDFEDLTIYNLDKLFQ